MIKYILKWLDYNTNEFRLMEKFLMITLLMWVVGTVAYGIQGFVIGLVLFIIELMVFAMFGPYIITVRSDWYNSGGSYQKAIKFGVESSCDYMPIADGWTIYLGFFHINLLMRDE